MAKKYKSLAAFAAVTGVVAIANRLIFKSNEKKSRRGLAPDFNFNFPHTELRFDWRYGTAKYVVCGEGEPVVLIHGAAIGSGLHDWIKIIPHLAKRRRVFAVDLPGYGLSDKPKLTYSSYLYASFVNDFIAGCVGGGACVIAAGESAGFVAAGHALRPELYMKLMVIGVKKPYRLPRFLSRPLGAFIMLPVYGTLAYHLLASKTAAGPAGRILSRCGGIGAKFPVSALMKNHLHVDLSRFAGKLKIPFRIESDHGNGTSPSARRSLCRAVADFILN